MTQINRTTIVSCCTIDQHLYIHIFTHSIINHETLLQGFCLQHKMWSIKSLCLNERKTSPNSAIFPKRTVNISLGKFHFFLSLLFFKWWSTNVFHESTLFRLRKKKNGFFFAFFAFCFKSRIELLRFLIKNNSFFLWLWAN